jgi:hypothetical protein
MAIRKEDLLTLLENSPIVSKNSKVKKYEVAIDDKLKLYKKGDEVFLDLNYLPSVSIQEELKEIYNKRGWNLKFCQHVSDGTWISIK